MIAVMLLLLHAGSVQVAFLDTKVPNYPKLRSYSHHTISTGKPVMGSYPANELHTSVNNGAGYTIKYNLCTNVHPVNYSKKEKEV